MNSTQTSTGPPTAIEVRDRCTSFERRPARHQPVACAVELLWLPLGAGQQLVRISGRAFEALVAAVARRPARALYHSALIVSAPDGRHVIEMTPVPDGHGERRGVVAEGVVGSVWLGRFRVFRYEIHRWHDGTIPDACFAVARTDIPLDGDGAGRLLDLISVVPTPVWGRDDLGAGEMWNSNSVTSWLLRRSGVDTTGLRPPGGGRAPGWDAGITVAARPGGD